MSADLTLSNASVLAQLAGNLCQALRGGLALPAEIAQAFTEVHGVSPTGHVLYSPQGNRIILPLRVGALKWRVMQVDYGRIHQDFEAMLPNGNRVQVSYSRVYEQMQTLKIAVIDIATNESARLYSGMQRQGEADFQTISTEGDNLAEIEFFLNSLLSAIKGAA